MARYKHIDSVAIATLPVCTQRSFSFLGVCRTLKSDRLLERDAAQIRSWLAAHPEERRGVKGSIRKSNRTDNESAKMATSKGVIQGYTGVAAVDGKHQIIVEAQAPRHRFGAGTARAGGGGDEGRTRGELAHHGGCGVSQRRDPEAARRDGG